MSDVQGQRAGRILCEWDHFLVNPGAVEADIEAWNPNNLGGSGMDDGHSRGRVESMCLPDEPQLCAELALLRNRMAETHDVNLALDLSRVEIISSPSIGILLGLHHKLASRGRRLILCRMRLATKCIFRIAGLEGVFDLVNDEAEALRLLGQLPGAPTEPRPKGEVKS